MAFIFPKDFLWGTAASSGQIEGAAFEDGKTENINDHCCRDPQYMKHYEGDCTPDVCADFYHKYPEDIILFKELGVKVFRYSISWARIYPNGPEKVNPLGIAYYNRVINKLIDAGIVPFIDIFHSDTPYWVITKGGIACDGFVEWYSKYARTCFEAFGDRVKYWSTCNEPKLNSYGVYAHAHTAPFLRDRKLALNATRNMILAHFNAVKTLRSLWSDAQIGSVHNMGKTYTLSFALKDNETAERHDQLQYLFLEPMLKGHYPEELRVFPEFMQFVTKEDEKRISDAFVPMDFYGINCYCPCFARYDPDAEYNMRYFRTDLPRDAYGFTTYPPVLFDTAMALKKKFPGVPFIITENGYTIRRDIAKIDIPSTLHDEARIHYIREHIREAWRILQTGAELKGYFYWSAVDCYEGTMGFGYDMGLIGINFETLERFPRDSYYYYQKVVTNGAVD